MPVPRIDVFDAEQESMAAHLADNLAPGKRGLEFLSQRRSTCGDVAHELVVDHVVENGEADRARKRRTVSGVPQIEGFRAAGESLVHVLAAQRCRQRGITGTKALPRGDDVRLDG